MTINSVTTLVVDRKLPTPPLGGQVPSKLQVHTAPDFPFKGWQPSQPEGYRQSIGTASESAIVIDNGKLWVSYEDQA